MDGYDFNTGGGELQDGRRLAEVRVEIQEVLHRLAQKIINDIDGWNEKRSTSISFYDDRISLSQRDESVAPYNRLITITRTVHLNNVRICDITLYPGNGKGIDFDRGMYGFYIKLENEYTGDVIKENTDRKGLRESKKESKEKISFFYFTDNDRTLIIRLKLLFEELIRLTALQNR